MRAANDLRWTPQPEELLVTIRLSLAAIALLALTSCKDKGEDTTTTDGGTGGDTAVTGDGGTTDGGTTDGGTTDGGTTDGGTTDGGTTDGGTTDGGTTDGGTTDGGSGDGGSGDGGGGSDTGGDSYVFIENWGTLLDGPSCALGPYGSIRSADDTLAIEVDFTALFKTACASKTYAASTTKPAEAFVVLRGTKLSTTVCQLAEGATDEATVVADYRLSKGTVVLSVSANSEWCLDDSKTPMGNVTSTWTDVLVTSGGDTQEMGDFTGGPWYLAATTGGGR
jgi:hypothetical protein